MTKGSRGRPIGYRMCEESKKAIASSKQGQFHKQETKDKISHSLIIYFKQFNSLADEVVNTYCRADDDKICGWANGAREELELVDDVMTEKSMYNIRRKEICCGHDIEHFSHGVTPEFIVILKELVDEQDLE